MTRGKNRARHGQILVTLGLLALFMAPLPGLTEPARAAGGANPYVLVEENMTDPLFDRAWVNADDFLLNDENARLHVMFQFSHERAEALQKEISAEAPPLLFMAVFEVNREEGTFRRGDYQILDAEGILLSQAQGWAEWQAARKDNPGALLLKVADQLEEALRAQGRWTD